MTTPNIGGKNWTKECEVALNEQIALEYWAHHQYTAMWSHFDRKDVGLHNIAKFLQESGKEEMEHAQAFISYQNKRGGVHIPAGVTGIDLDFLKSAEDKSDALLAFEKALAMEQHVYQALLKLHKVAEDAGDAQFTDYIESEYLEEQIDAIAMLSSKCTQLQRIGNNGHGVWHFDNDFKSE